MIKKTIEKVKAEVIQDILCNKCGCSLIVRRFKINNPIRLDHGEEKFIAVGIQEVKFYGQYDSIHLEDGKRYSFSLCEKCTKDLMDQFVIPAESTEE